MYSLNDVYTIFESVTGQEFFTNFGIESFLLGLIGVSIITLIISLLIKTFKTFYE